jgi:hypothetical protein
VRNRLALALIFFGSVSLAARAQETAPTVDSPQGTETALKIKFGAVLDAYESFNFTNAVQGLSGLGNIGLPLNSSDGSPVLALAEFSLTATQGEGSLHLSLIYGEAANYFYGTTAPSNTNPWEAYFTYQPGPWTFTIGKMVSHVGYEVLESKDNWNYSRSILYVTTPSLHVGLKVNYTLDDKSSVTACYYNSWDGLTGLSPSPQPEGRSYGFQFDFKPSADWHVTLNGISGAVSPGDPADPTAQYLLEGIAVFEATDKFSLALDAEYGGHKNPSSPGTVSDFWGLALYGRYQFEEGWAVAARLEEFKDNQNTFELYGAASIGDIESREVTLTLEHAFTPNLLARLEGRYDCVLSGGQPYDDGLGNGAFANGTSKDQVTATAGVVFSLL